MENTYKYKCFICSQKFNEENEISNHLAKQHGKKDYISTFQCVVNGHTCGKTFKTLNGVLIHSRLSRIKGW